MLSEPAISPFMETGPSTVTVKDDPRPGLKQFPLASWILKDKEKEERVKKILIRNRPPNKDYLII